MSQAGIRNIDAAKQPVDFSKLNPACGKQSTDIDISMDVNGRWFSFGEAKYMGAPCPEGQRIHLASLVNAIRAPCDGRDTDAYAYITSHSTPPGEDKIDPSTALVTEYYWNLGYWRKCLDPVPINIFRDGMLESMKKKRELSDPTRLTHEAGLE